MILQNEIWPHAFASQDTTNNVLYWSLSTNSVMGRTGTDPTTGEMSYIDIFTHLADIFGTTKFTLEIR